MKTKTLDRFAVFILSHGRPDNVITYGRIKAQGYTGKIYIIVDDLDASLPKYKENYGDELIVFSKKDIFGKFDEGINKTDMRTTCYPRNAMWDIAKDLGVDYFCQLDDDYTNFSFRMNGPKTGFHGFKMKNLDRVFETLVQFMMDTKTTSIAMSQGGDHMGGDKQEFRLLRKAMNSFVCKTDRPFMCIGKMNEDVNAYLVYGKTGSIFFTFMPYQLNQLQTQTQSGGMTESYLDSGTYVKSFYSVMFSPSCVKVAQMGSTNRRWHHSINWRNAVPKIISEQWRK